MTIHTIKKTIIFALLLFLVLIFLVKFFQLFYFEEVSKETLEREFELSIHRPSNRPATVKIKNCTLRVDFESPCNFSTAIRKYAKVYNLKSVRSINIRKTQIGNKNLFVADFSFRNADPGEAFRIEYEYCEGNTSTSSDSLLSSIFLNSTEYIGRISRNINIYIDKNCRK